MIALVAHRARRLLLAHGAVDRPAVVAPFEAGRARAPLEAGDLGAGLAARRRRREGGAGLVGELAQLRAAAEHELPVGRLCGVDGLFDAPRETVDQLRGPL
jgi:hypothetical protein